MKHEGTHNPLENVDFFFLFRDSLWSGRVWLARLPGCGGDVIKKKKGKSAPSVLCHYHTRGGVQYHVSRVSSPSRSTSHQASVDLELFAKSRNPCLVAGLTGVTSTAVTVFPTPLGRPAPAQSGDTSPAWTGPIPDSTKMFARRNLS